MKKARGFIMMFTLMLMVVGAYFVAGTYAKYTSEVTGTATVEVARWSFVDDNETTTVNVTLDGTVDQNTLIDGLVAPGTSGSFGVNVNTANTDVGVNYTIAVTAVGNMPTNLKLYSARSCVEEGCTYDESNLLAEGTFATPITLTGTLGPQNAIGANVELYWVWAYETTDGDDEDTADGSAAEDFSFTVTISGTQVEPLFAD